MDDAKKKAERFFEREAAVMKAAAPNFMAPALGAAAEALIDAGEEITLQSLVNWCHRKGSPYAEAADEALRRAARSPRPPK